MTAAIPTPPGGPILWTGDLEDDCVCRWQGMVGHAECLGDDLWFAGVTVEGDDGYLFHACEHDTQPVTGDAARRLCELVMRHHFMARLLAAMTSGLGADTIRYFTDPEHRVRLDAELRAVQLTREEFEEMKVAAEQDAGEDDRPQDVAARIAARGQP